MKASGKTRNPVQLTAAERRALLARRMKQGRGPKIYPLSFAQEGLWFVEQAGSGEAQNVLQLCYRVEGPLDLRALDRGFEALVERHEVLRTRFLAQDGRPFQAVMPSVSLVLPLLDLGALAEEERSLLRAALVRRHLLEPLDLGRGPLLQGLVIRLGPARHVLFFKMHHLVSDAWSLGVLVRELSALYAAVAGGAPVRLEPLPAQYGEVARAQRRRLRGAALERDLGYWRDRLEGLEPLLELPISRGRGGSRTGKAGAHTFALGAGARERVAALARGRGVTPFMVFLAAFQSLLGRYTGRQDLALGTLVAGRDGLELEPLIGFFINTVVLRASVSARRSFLEQVEATSSSALEALDHQQVPFDKLVEALSPERRPDRHPVVQVTFQLQTAAVPELRLAGNECTLLEPELTSSPFDLSLYLDEHQGRLRALLVYRRDLYEASSIERLGSHYRTLLDGVLEEPEEPLARLPILGPGELEQIRALENGAPLSPAAADVVALVRDRAREQPEKVAVTDGRLRLSYGELSRRAAALAAALEAAGAGAEDVVGVFVARSVDVAVALVGVLESGACYLPLDPAYPQDRLKAMLEDAGAKLVVAAGEAVEAGDPAVTRLERETGVGLVGLVGLGGEADGPAGGALDAAGLRHPAQAAYLLFTSGSTGRPKGVWVSRGALADHVASARAAYELRSGDTVLQFSSLSFDTSLEQLLGAFAVGATVLLRDEDVWTPADLLDRVREQGLTVANLPTAYWHQAVREWRRSGADLGATRLRLVQVGGEELPASALEDWHALAAEGRPRLLNVYGPTETAITATGCPVERERDGAEAGRVTIGRPFAGRLARVLDRTGRQVPLRVPGELHLGGIGLARGYAGRPGATAEVFVPDPAPGRPGARLYRTGDLVRLLPDGELDFLGRVDRQVKLRGFRIEPGEVESALRRLAGIAGAVVLVRPAAAGESHLVGFFVAESEARAADVTPTALRVRLQRSLPAHMIPNALVAVESFPLTVNGKVDRRALAALERPREEAPASAAGLRTPTEELVAGCFSDVLRAEVGSSEADFFELGGHSLLATQAVSRLRGIFRLEIPVKQVFSTPTVASLAAALDDALRRGENEAAPAAIVRGDLTGPAPLSYAQERVWFFSRLAPDSALYNIAGLYRLRGRVRFDALAAALRALGERHEGLRSRFAEMSGRPMVVVEDQPELPVSWVDLRGLHPAVRRREASRLAGREAVRGFALDRAPLWRFTFLRIEDDDCHLALSFHHIISDGWSFGVFLSELSALYREGVAGPAAALPALAVRYADFAAWQRRWLQGDELERQLGFWRRSLDGAPTALDFPTDRPRGAVQSFRGGLVTVEMPPAEVTALRALSRSAGASLFMTLLAGFRALILRCAGARDALVGIPIANRNRPEVEGLIGFFVNSLVLRADASDDPAFDRFLHRIREATLAAYAHQDLPFEKLVEEFRPQRDLSRTPLFQVMLSLQNAARGSLQLQGVEVAAEPLDTHTSKLDLTLHFTETGQGGLTGAVEYNADLFDRVTVLRLAGQLRRLLAAFALEAGQRLTAPELLSARERAQVLGEWNDTARAYGEARCLHELFAEQVERTPEAVALVCGEESLSYRRLDERANRLAHALCDLGVGPEVRVGVAMERSVEMVVALYGILKAGGAYVPLDPEYPAERLASMTEDSSVPVLLTQERLLGRLPETPARILCLDRDRENVEARPSAPPEVEVDPDGLAYVIYTSGSTGKPKGAMNSHRGIHNRLLWMQEAFGLDASDRVLQKTPFSFDVSVWEFFWPLVTGAALVLAEPGGHRDPGYLARTVAERRITTLHFVPSMLQIFLAQRGLEGCAGLRRVIASGEALPLPLVERFCERLPGVELHNLYGPTEAAIDVTWWPCTPASRRRGLVPIGRPIANTRLHVLDTAARPVPVGVPGELLLGGVQLARGYHARPALTAERFVPDPVAAAPGERLYRTGDEVRWLADGAVEFLGRIDFQVKLRGFRIELGEIEAVLAEHPAVRQCAVVVREDSPGDPRLTAYAVAVDPAAPADPEALRGHLAARLPEHMVPAMIVAMEALPLSPNGKVDRRALPAPTAERAHREAGAAPSRGVEKAVAEIWCRVLKTERVGLDDSFFDLGGHSLLLAEVQTLLREALGEELSLVELFQFPTVRSLAARIEPREAPARAPGAARVASRDRDEPIAIVAMAGRFPGARGVDELWHNLCGGVESISFFGAEELEGSILGSGDLEDPSFVPAAGVLEDADLFDAAFFGYTPREAEVMDPQQRLFLECAWEALELAGSDPRGTAGRVGVYAGIGMNTYMPSNLLANPKAFQAAGAYQVMLGNDKDFLPTRVSYKLDLKGPSLAVQTACSTSLVAVHLACRALAEGECDMALAGGVTVKLPQRMGYRYEPGGILSPDGRCRPFDAGAGGTLAGNGVGVVVLKPLAAALADGDPVRAVIRGTAINNDGSLKVGFTAPAVDGQAEVIEAALTRAGVDADTVGYVEAHGTGTELGDPIEVAALTRAYRRSTDRRGYCALGSLKSNLGHLDTAAGVAGLIKAALAVERSTVPPSLHFEKPNPEIDFGASPFFVPTEAVPWPQPEGPRRAAVSSFGIGGTNAHAVIEEAPEREPSGPSRPAQLLLLSARSGSALEDAARRLGAYLEERPEVPLADVAHTLRVGRHLFEHRMMLVAEDAAEASTALLSGDRAQLTTRREEDADRPVVFLFPGQGAQYVGMGRELYETEPTFREAVDRASGLLKDDLGLDLRELLYPEPDAEAQAAERLSRTRFTQPALFAVEHALARLWMEWGLVPAAMIGHSVGEYTAATLAGVLSLEDALRLLALRGRLMEELPAGTMLSLPLEEAAAREWLARPGFEEISVAALNAPGLTTVAGPAEAVEAFVEALAAEGVEARRLHTSHAFHSAMMEPMLPAFRQAVEALEIGAPAIPYVSNVTGRWITAEEVRDPDYWVRHVRREVRFADGAALLLEDGERAFVEVGPGRTLATLLRQQAGPGADRVVVGSLRPPKGEEPDVATLLGNLGRLHLGGVRVDWHGFVRHERRRRLALPTYPFARQRFWVEPRPEGFAGLAAARREVEDYFSVASWRRSPPAAAWPEETAPERWLLLADREGLGEALAAWLRARGRNVATAVAGDSFEAVGPERFRLVPDRAEDYAALFRRLESAGGLPERIVHLWSLAPASDAPLPDAPAVWRERFGHAQTSGFYSLLALGRALIAQHPEHRAELCAVTTGLFRLDGREGLEPEKTTLLGPLRVLQQEHPQLACRALDLDTGAEPDPAARWAEPGRLALLAAELAVPEGPPAVALRGGRRWLQAYEPMPLPAPEGPPRRLREGGVYLITGGLGLIGLHLARALAEELEARLVLVGRTAFPKPSAWDGWVKERGPEDPTSRKITALRRLEEVGAEVMVAAADVADREAMADVVAAAVERFGRLDGVIHGAGVVGERAARLVAQSDREASEEQFRAKVHGLLVLDEVLAGRGVGFALVMSSISTALGGLGFAAYSAANHYADAWVEAVAGHRETAWISVGWDGWLPEGAVVPGGESMLRPKQGIEAFRRVLDLPREALPESPVLVSKDPLEPRLERWLSIRALREALGVDGRDGELYERPDLDTDYAAPASPEQEALASIWRELLGIERIGVHDDFFELGGHSLMATQLLTRLRGRFGVEVSLQQVFASPTIAGLAALLGADAARETAPVPPIVAVPRDRPLRLSYPQERLWFLQRLDPKSIAYNLPAAIRLDGRLGVEALRRSFDEIVRRHEVLRTRFEEVDGEPRQRIGPARAFSLPLIDFQGLDTQPQRRDAELFRLAFRMAEEPFDLARGPLVRNALVRLARESHVLLSACHHLVSDGWSGTIYVREIGALYQAFLKGGPSPLEPLEIQYPDFAEWQRSWLQGEALEGQLGYWRERLEGIAPELPLPYDRHRVRDHVGAAGRTALRVPEETAAPLHRYAQEKGMTPFMLAMAALHVLLGRYAAATDVAVGTPIANRHRPGTEDLVGVFINTLVIRSDLAGNPSFDDFAKQIRAVTLGAYACQDVPYEKLVEALQPQGGSGRGFFQVLMAFNHASYEAPQVEGLSLDLVDLDSRRDEALFDLALGITDADGAFEVSVQYDRELFDWTTVERMMAAYGRLLAALAAEPSRPVHGVPLFGAGESHQLVFEWPTAGASVPAELEAAYGRLPGASGRRDFPAVAIVADAGERVPIGVWGELCWILESDRVSSGLRGRYLASGQLVVASREAAPAEETGTGGARRSAARAWDEVSARKSGLSAHKQGLLEARLRGRSRRRRSAEGEGETADGRRAGTNLVRIQPTGRLEPLFCVHAIAGDVTYYTDLADQLGPERPFFALEASGLGGVRAPLDTVEEMAALYVEKVLAERPEGGPYFLAGWSMGAVVSFEMARQLTDAGREVALLILLEPSLPGNGAPPPPLDDDSIIDSLIDEVEALRGPLPLSRPELDSLPLTARLRSLFEWAGTGDRALGELIDRSSPQVLEVYRKNKLALNRYRPARYAGPVAMIFARERQATPVEEIARSWSRLVAGPCTREVVPGNHTTMLRGPNAEHLAKVLRAQMERLGEQQLDGVAT